MAQRTTELTCKHHPNLRWVCNGVAWSDEYGYNGSRNIFFCGSINEPVTFVNMTMECDCSASDLVRTENDKKQYPIHKEEM